MIKKIICAALIILAVHPICSAQLLQPPSPTPWEISQPPKPKSETPQPQKNGDQIGTKALPLVVETLESQSDADEKRTARHYRDEEAANNRRTVVLTGLLLLAAVVQAGLFVWQLSYMRSSVVAAAAAARAAEKSAEVSEKALRITQRAYIGVGHWNIDGLQQKQRPKNFGFQLSNNSQTTATVCARHVRGLVAIQLPDTPLYAEKTSEVFPVPIGPGQKHMQWVELASLSDADLADVLSETKYFWLWGYIEYLDVFGETHRTGFSVRYDTATGSLRMIGPDGYNYST